MKHRFLIFLAVMLFLCACTPNPATKPTETDRAPETETTAPAAESTASETEVVETETEAVETEAVETDVPVTEASILNPQTGTPWDGVTLSVDGARVVIGVPLLLSNEDLRSATVSFTLLDGTTVGPVVWDLTTKNTLVLTDGENPLSCTVTAQRLTYDLPILEINIDDGSEIVDKNTYSHGTLSVNGIQYDMKIKGRGNASWNMFPKKSYRIKLDSGASLLGLPKNRDWVLTSNYADKTLIRNCVAHTVAASLSGLEYTPTHIPVNLYINGEYRGVYTFGDKIENGSGRLELGETVYGENNTITDMGFLLEIGWDFDEENVYNRDYFDTELAFRIFVKDPEITVANSPEFLYLKNYVVQMEQALINNSGWEDYIDLDSWVDWFIVNELTFNTESSFYRSCYLWKPVGGKLQLGPVWDFDMAFGNHYGDLAGYDGWCTTESTYTYISENWMNRLITYPAFTERLVSRWNEVKNELLTTAIGAVDEYEAMLEGSQEQNFALWDIMTVGVGAGSVDYRIYDTYEKQVQYLRDFINTRWQYIDRRLNEQP